MKSTEPRAYLSGPMTGIPELNHPAFNKAAAKLRAEGKYVFNPAEVPADDSWVWGDYMRADLKALMDCTELFVLPGWERSKGAKLEMYVAMALGMNVTMVKP